mgnify:FL=1
MIILVKLLLAHILADFIWQPKHWVVHKEIKKHRSIYLYIHSFLHGLISYVLIAEFNFFWYAVLIMLSHGIIDYIKISFQNKKTSRNWFFIDQIAHIIIIVLVFIMYHFNKIPNIYFTDKFWKFSTAIIFLTLPSSIIIRTIISKWTPLTKDDALQNAGNFIGIVERLFVFYFVISANITAIGFLFTAKSIFRFGDLTEAKDRKLTEYVLIGTLLSFGIAFLLALLVNFVLLEN